MIDATDPCPLNGPPCFHHFYSGFVTERRYIADHIDSGHIGTDRNANRMSQEQALQDPSSSAQQGSHSDDADLYSDYAPTTPPMTPPSTPPSTPPMTPVTTAISPELKGNPNRLDRDSIIETLGGGTTKKSVRTGKNGQPQSSSEQVSV